MEFPSPQDDTPLEDLHTVRRAEVLAEQTGIPYSEALERITGRPPTPIISDDMPRTESSRTTDRRSLGPRGQLRADGPPPDSSAHAELMQRKTGPRPEPEPGTVTAHEHIQAKIVEHGSLEEAAKNDPGILGLARALGYMSAQSEVIERTERS